MPTPDTMRAWQVMRIGEPIDVLELCEVATPSIGHDDVLVKVRAVSLNFPDVLLARGEYQVRPELPFIPGIELCGEVVARGAGVERPAIGDRVVGSKIGVLADYAALPAAAVHDAPPGLDDAQASGLTIAYQTAWFGLHRRAALQSGETLLVHAAAGGVGLAAVQLGAAAGARVIGVVGSPAKVDVALAAGAHRVIVRGRDDLIATVKEETTGRGADVVFDPVGGDSFEQSTRCIAFEGRIVVVGFAGGTIPEVRANHALVKNYSVLGLHWGLYPSKRPELVVDAHARLSELAASGTISPLVAAVVPFEEAAAGAQELAGGTTVGRIVVRVGGDG